MANRAQIQQPRGKTNQLAERRIGGLRLEWRYRVVEFLDQDAAGAFDKALGRVDAGIILFVELAFKCGKGLLKHRRMLPMGAEGADTGIPIGAHAALGDGPRTNRARSRRSISYGLMQVRPRPMQAFGILIFRVESD